jgi:hypothetical protein
MGTCDEHLLVETFKPSESFCSYSTKEKTRVTMMMNSAVSRFIQLSVLLGLTLGSAEAGIPTPKATSSLRRRLSEPSVDQLAAEKACEHWGKGKDDCVFDVLTTGDLDMATQGDY